ncbi:Ig-like domain-containing protein [Hymenobacter bucti]|uniref:Ig-like domain-containing protein n=1 Tax=Hymenobacter bucti TaxID=1844114 RepID=A0ABW4R272_9BACT
MKRNLLWAVLSLLGLLAPAARAQTAVPLAQETFEGVSTDWGYSANSFNSPATTTPFSPLSYFERKQLSSSGAAYPGTTQPLTNQQGSYAFAGENVRGFGTTVVRSAGYVVLNPIPAAGYQNLRVTVALAAPRGGGFTGAGANGVTAADRIRLQYSFDGGPFVTAGLLVSSDPVNNGDFQQDTSSPLDSIPEGLVLGQAFQDISADIAGTGTSLRVRVVADTRGAELAFDNIRVTGVLNNTPTPTLSGLETTAASYTEGGSPVQLTNSLTVGYSNGSATTLTGATVRISSNFAAQDQLDFTNQPGITGSYNTGTGVLTLNGTTSQAAYQAALRSITYSNTNTTTLNTGTRQITFQVRNGAAVSNSPVRTLTIRGTLNAPAALNYTENFDTDGDGTRYFGNAWAVAGGARVGSFRATTSPATYNGTQVGNATFTGYSGGYWFGEGTVSTANPTNPYGLVQLAPVNAAGRSNLRFTVAIGAAGNWLGYFDAANPGDRFELFYSTDGGTTLTQFGAFYGVDGTAPARQDADLDPLTPAAGTQLSPALQDFTFVLPPAAAVSNLTFVLRQRARGQSEIAYDNIRITAAMPPTVATGTAGSLTGSTAAVSGNTLAADGGANVSDYGVVYVAGTGTPTTANSKVQVGTTQPASFPTNFTANLTGLAAGTQYTARAYATNSVGTSYGTAVSFTTPTTVAAIVRADPSPTNASQVRFTVTFATPVTGLTSSNFSLATDGTLAGGSVGSVSGAGTTYTVAVNTGTGSGSLRLNLDNSTGLSPGVSNVPFTTGESYTIDKTAPTVVISSTAGSAGSTTATTPLPFTVTFSESVTGFVAGDVAVTNGTLAGFSGAGSTYTFNVTPAAAGAVTVTVPANAATDQANNGNAAATQFSITYQPPVVPTTAAPVLTDPANNSTTTGTPTFSGTAPAGSTVTVYLATNGGAAQAIGTATAVGGTFSLTPATALADGTYAAYATAQSSGASVSANSSVVNFTVDTVAPTVTLTSPAGASGSTTPTTPFAFTATFSEAVTGFSAGGITVTNGTVSSGPAGSGNTYTFAVTPTTAGIATTVALAAGAAQDAANNGNVASAPYTLTYQPTPTIADFNPPNGPVSTQVTITGTGFVNVMAVAFNGTAASSFTVTSATSLMATVAAGTTTGPVSVRTAGGTATSATPFTVRTAPVANPDTYTTPANTLLTGNVLSNDQGRGLRAQVVSLPQQGTLTFNPDGSFGYTPASGYSGIDRFTYQACDNGSPSLCSNATTVTISVQPAAATAPVVTTAAPANVASTSATLGGTVSSEGNTPVTARGVVYSSTNAMPILGGSGTTTAVASSGGPGSFTVAVSGLAPGTQYTARAYATNSVGTSYGAAQTFTTSVSCASFAPSISVTPANTTYTGGVPSTLYLGYGAQTVTLTASGGGSGATYQWSPTTGLSNPASATTTFTATKAGTFTYTVTVRAASGCVAMASITLIVIDARCGSGNSGKNDKVLVCHNGNELCLASAAVAAHLQHGDQLGTCPSSKAQTQAQAARLVEPATTTDTSEDSNLEAYPNPFTTATTVRFRAALPSRVQLQLYNALGQLVATLYDGQVQAGQLLERTLDGTQLSAGLYICRLSTAGQTLTQRVVLSR